MSFLNTLIEVFTPSFLIIFIMKLGIQRYLASDVEKALETNLERFARVALDYVLSLLYVLVISIGVYSMVKSSEINSTINNETDTLIIQAVIIIVLFWGILFLGVRSVLGIRIFLPKRTYFIQDGKQFFIEKTIKKNFILLSYDEEEPEKKQLFKVISYEQIIGLMLHVETDKEIFRSRGKQFYTILEWYKQGLWRKVFLISCAIFLFIIAFSSFFNGFWPGITTLLMYGFVVVWHYLHIKYYKKVQSGNQKNNGVGGL